MEKDNLKDIHLEFETPSIRYRSFIGNKQSISSYHKQLKPSKSFSSTTSENSTTSSSDMEHERSPFHRQSSAEVLPADQQHVDRCSRKKKPLKFLRIAAYVSSKLSDAISLLDLEADTINYATNYRSNSSPETPQQKMGSIYQIPTK